MNKEHVNHLGQQYAKWISNRSAWRFDERGRLIHCPTLNVIQIASLTRILEQDERLGIAQIEPDRFDINIGIMVLLMWFMDTQETGIRLADYIEKICLHRDIDDYEFNVFLNSYICWNTNKSVALRESVNRFPWAKLGVNKIEQCVQFVILSLNADEFFIVDGPIDRQ